MAFQRDKASFDIVHRLFQSLWQALGEKRRGQSDKANMALVRAADCWRILGWQGQAQRMLVRVIADATSNKTKFWALHALAVSYHYGNQYELAEQQFLASQKLANDLQLSFSYQHLAKLYIDQGRHDAAQPLLQEALQIRQLLNHPALVDSTNKAIEGLAELLGEDSLGKDQKQGKQ